jgi:hypothetical protein
MGSPKKGMKKLMEVPAASPGTASGRRSDTCGHRHPEKRRTEAAMAYNPKA